MVQKGTLYRMDLNIDTPRAAHAFIRTILAVVIFMRCGNVESAYATADQFIAHLEDDFEGEGGEE